MPSGVFTLKQVEQAIGQGAWTNQPPISVNYLVVAGGGGASQGGGGAGGLLQGTFGITAGTSYTVTVGSGGGAYTQGSNSVFGSLTATGGGTGGGGSGGSGGGGNSTAVAGSVGGQGTSGQGNAGGNGSTTSGVGGGGGGAGTVGLAGAGSVGGNGGAGVASDISGTRTAYSGGGGGAASSGGSGGAGGGGSADVNGSANSGGGGGGGWAGAPKSGGSGIVIISYPDTYAAPASTTGSPTVSTSGSGSIALNGTNQYLSGPSTALLNYSTGSFTVEFWVYATTIGALTIFFSASNATQDFQIGLSPTNYLYWHNSGNQITNAGNAASCPLNQWNHIVLVRSGSSCALYCNGTRFGTATNSAAVNLTQFVIGTYWNGAPNYSTTGNITNVRISNTNMYNPNSSSITVPTAPFVPSSSTNFLLSAVSGSQFADSSSSGLILGAPNSPTWNQLSPFATGLGYKNRVYTWASSGSITF